MKMKTNMKYVPWEKGHIHEKTSWEASRWSQEENLIKHLNYFNIWKYENIILCISGSQWEGQPGDRWIC